MQPKVRYQCKRETGVPGNCPSATMATELMAEQLRAAVADAAGDVGAMSTLLESLMAQQGGSGESPELAEVAFQMISHLQFFDLLSQRIQHIANVLDAIAGADGLPGEMLPSFDVLVALLKQQYSCAQEQNLHKAFLTNRTAGCRLADDDFPSLSFDIN